MAVEEAGGTVLGRPIEVLSADDQDKADVGAEIARRWYAADGVTAIFDVLPSNVALAVQTIARDKNGIVVFSGGTTTELTNHSCSPVGFQWMQDSYSLTTAVGQRFVQQGTKTWFFITVDYEAGHAIKRFAAAGIERAGGKLLGEVLTPLATTDYAAALLAAQASGAQAIGLALSGTDLTNAIKQAAEFGLTAGPAKLVAFGMFITEAHALGTKLAGGIDLATGFYWDRTEASRAWSQAYFKRMNRMPSQVQAGVYSAVRHYLKAVAAAGTTQTEAVVTKMRALPVDDMATQNATIRADGRLLRDMYLAEIKHPGESHDPWDYYRITD
jgi:branched-chain amino acid transport system substrate-binding protein